MYDIEEEVVKCDEDYPYRCGEWEGKLKDAVKRETFPLPASASGWTISDDGVITTEPADFATAYFCPQCNAILKYDLSTKKKMRLVPGYYEEVM